jgi:hypothetical protein
MAERKYQFSPAPFASAAYRRYSYAPASTWPPARLNASVERMLGAQIAFDAPHRGKNARLGQQRRRHVPPRMARARAGGRFIEAQCRQRIGREGGRRGFDGSIGKGHGWNRGVAWRLRWPSLPGARTRFASSQAQVGDRHLRPMPGLDRTDIACDASPGETRHCIHACRVPDSSTRTLQPGIFGSTNWASARSDSCQPR